MPDSLLNLPDPPAQLSRDELRGRLEATPEEQVIALQNNQLRRESGWEGFAGESAGQFVGLLGVITSANPCSAEARSR